MQGAEATYHRLVYLLQSGQLLSAPHTFCNETGTSAAGAAVHAEALMCLMR